MGYQLNFDASQVAPSVAPEAKPAGWYVCMMTASELKPTKDNSGSFLECEFTILAPTEYANQKFFDRLNLQNQNPAAVEIAYKTLSAICHATGVIQVQDSAVLHNRPLQLKVNLRPAGPGGDGVFREASNEVKGYKAIDRAVPQQSAAQQWQPPVPPVAAAPQWQQPQAPAVQPPAPPAQAPQWQPPAPPAPPPAAPQWQPPVQQTPPAPPPAAPPAPPAPPATPDPGLPPWLQKPAG